MGTNADIVRSLYGEDGRRWDPATLDDFQQRFWHPEITWHAIEGALDDVGLMEGRERVRRYYDEWLEVYDDLTVERTHLEEIGGRVVAGVCVHGRSSSGAIPETHLNFAIVFELRDGQVLSGREYATLDEALDAARA